MLSIYLDPPKTLEIPTFAGYPVAFQYPSRCTESIEKSQPSEDSLSKCRVSIWMQQEHSKISTFRSDTLIFATHFDSLNASKKLNFQRIPSHISVCISMQQKHSEMLTFRGRPFKLLGIHVDAPKGSQKSQLSEGTLSQLAVHLDARKTLKNVNFPRISSYFWVPILILDLRILWHPWSCRLFHEIQQVECCKIF